jgi:hypothetical protein
MLHEHVEFLERAVIEKHFDALAGGEFSALVLGVDSILAAAEAGAFAALFESFENVFHEAIPVLAAACRKKKIRARFSTGRGSPEQAR